MKRLVYHYEIETDSSAQMSEIYGVSRVGYISAWGIVLEIYVNSNDPGKLPHFHVRNKDDWSEFHSCIRIDCAEYFAHGNKVDVLSSKEKKALQQFMSSDVRQKLFSEDGRRLTDWEYVCILWNDNNSDVTIEENLVQPDYMQL